MNADYFSDREYGPKPRTNEVISADVWCGTAAEITARIGDGSFGKVFPQNCDEGPIPVGTDMREMGAALKAEVPEIPWPLDSDVPKTHAILDFIEFCYKRIAKPEKLPIDGRHQSYYKHNHLTYDIESGKTEFRDKVNLIFARNGLAYDLKENGQIERLAPPGLRDILKSAVFNTSDSELDKMLESARRKFLDPNPAVRREAVEKLWDAWERLKTLEPGKDKKAKTKVLLDKSAGEHNFRDLLESEANALTKVGNDFMIRHSETNKIPIKIDTHVDYLFHRLFALIWLLLQSR